MSDSANWTRHGITDTRLVRHFSYVNGKWVAGDGNDTLSVSNPADGTLLGEVASMSGPQARAAVDGAQEAFATWGMTLPQERSAVLRRWLPQLRQQRTPRRRSM